ncbi:MAG: exodeoxyribonuclease III [Pseudomonadota bacterium]
MAITICTWNINSVRLREGLVLDLLNQKRPDVLCLQESKSPVEKIPTEGFGKLGYHHMVARGQKGYNGVVILSRHPLEDLGHRDFCQKGDARHVSARLENGLTIQNFYIPAGGDEPDREANEKFDHKLSFVTEMTDWFTAEPPSKTVIVGDFNIAPLEEDVWSHKQLLKVVSHTPIEVEHLDAMKASANWVDTTRTDMPSGKVYSWWSYRARDWSAADKGRRLDHIWVTPDLTQDNYRTEIVRAARGWERPSDHAPVFATINI